MKPPVDLKPRTRRSPFDAYLAARCDPLAEGWEPEPRWPLATPRTADECRSQAGRLRRLCHHFAAFVAISLFVLVTGAVVFTIIRAAVRLTGGVQP